jgi:WD40 repeat protein
MSDFRLPLSPYKGLTPFSEGDAPFFFGRDIERRIISANLRTQRLTVLYGPSGVGKSSVINAGVVYHLRQRAQQVKDVVLPAGSLAGSTMSGRLRVPGARAELPGHIRPTIVVVFSTWDGDPLELLKDEVLTSLKKSWQNVLQADEEQDLRALKLTEMIEGVLKATEGAELLIILDQFEEYFVYHPVAEGAGKFDDEFSRALVNLGLRANFLISIREDWLARLDRFKGRIPNLFENSIRIDHLERAAAREAISKPIDMYNDLIRNQGDGRQPEVVITEDFINESLEQLEQLEEHDDDSLESPLPGRGSQSAGRRIQTSRLQIVMQHLWDKVKDDSPPTLGVELLDKPDTARRIIQSHLHESLEHLTPHERLIAANFFRFLITESGTKFASTAEGLAARCECSTEKIRAILEKLSERDVRILNRVSPLPGQPNEPRYEITSDVLAAPIINWIKEMREVQRHKVATRKKFVIVTIFLLCLIVISVVSAFFNVRQQRQEIDAARRVTDIERGKLQEALDIIRIQDEGIPYSKAVLRGHPKPIVSAFFTSSGRVLTASTDGSAILWDIESKKKLSEFSRKQDPLISASSNPQTDVIMIGSLEPSSLKNVAVMGSLDGRVILWNTDTQENVLLRGPASDHVTDVRFSPDSEIVVAATTIGTVIVWKAATREMTKSIPSNGAAIRQLAFSPRGKFLAAASDNHTVRLWRVSDWSERVLKGHTGRINGLAFSPDEESVATASADKTVRVWNLLTNTSRVFGEHTDSVNSVSFNYDGSRILSASDDKTARIWDLKDTKVVELSGHGDKVLSASFDPTGAQVITGSKDTTARIWDAHTGWNVVVLRGHSKQVTYVAFAPDGTLVLTAGDDGTARVWNVPHPGTFNLKEPAIDAVPKHYVGPCPVTIRFFVTLTALNGSGTVTYRLRGSDGRIWPIRTQPFNEPGLNYLNWYWRITKDYVGSETIEVIEPTNIKPQKATFTVKCTKNESTSPEPITTETPK